MTTQTNIKLVPKLRFKEFEGEIPESKFGDYYSFHSTNSLSRDKLNYEVGDVYNIHYGDIHKSFQTHFYLKNENVPLILDSINLSKIKEDSYCKNGDIVIADASEDYNDIGKSIELIDISNQKLLAGLHTFLARPITDKTSVGYVGFLLKSWKLRKQIMVIAQGTKVLSLATGRVLNLKLNIPSLPEQKKIASFLSAVDEKINQLNQKANLLTQYKKGVMQQLFSGKLRFKIKNEDGELVEPPDWEEKKLGEVGAIVSGLTYSPVDINPKGVLVLRSSNVKNRRLSFVDCVYVKTEAFNPVIESDILICVRNGSKRLIGKNTIIDKKTSGVAFGAFMSVYRSDYNYYLYHYFDTDFYKKEVHKNLGATINSINGSDLKKFKIPFPTLKEQEKIATYLTALDAKIEQVNTQIEKAKTFKKGLLQQMFV